MVYDCIVIGAGAAGLFFGAAAPEGVKGLILEKTSRVGTKLLMSGSGQCNITHSGSVKDFVNCYGKNGRHIRSCLYRHSNSELTEFLEANGIAVYERSDGKIFPASMKAEDVRKMLLGKCRKNGFEIKHNANVCAVKKDSSCMWNVSVSASPSPCSGGSVKPVSYTAENIVVATGGCSYPSTGSDGSFFDVLRKDLGISIAPLKPALSPVSVRDYPYGALSGISFENAYASIWKGDKSCRRRAAENTGGLLFTHGEFSGPVILNISKYAEPGDTVMINYLYPASYEQTLGRLKQISCESKCDMTNILASCFNLPKRFCRLITERYGTSPKKLALKLTSEEFTVLSNAGFRTAMATSGGISLCELNTKTMEVKKHPGIYSVGEVCDIDGITGGYNLQFAYSSARAAGEAIFGQSPLLEKR